MDVYVLRSGPDGALETLLLRRGAAGRSPGSWEGVHGHLEPGETLVQAGRRELAEETGLVPLRFYNLSRVEGFYLHRRDAVALVPAFAAWVATDATVRLGAEHDASRWLPLAEAQRLASWPRIRRALADAEALLGAGDAGALEDVLRVEE